jgi:hypothetical protein
MKGISSIARLRAIGAVNQEAPRIAWRMWWK